MVRKHERKKLCRLTTFCEQILQRLQYKSIQLNLLCLARWSVRSSPSPCCCRYCPIRLLIRTKVLLLLYVWYCLQCNWYISYILRNRWVFDISAALNDILVSKPVSKPKMSHSWLWHFGFETKNVTLCLGSIVPLAMFYFKWQVKFIKGSVY